MTFDFMVNYIYKLLIEMNANFCFSFIYLFMDD